MAPLVVVLIPVHGDARQLEVTLGSLLAATLPARLCTLIVDDGSEPPLALDAARYAPLGLELIRSPRNEGIARALNRGLERARGLGAGYVARLDALDTVDPERLMKQLAYLEAHPDAGLVASDVLFIGEDGKPQFRFEAPRTDAQVRRRMPISCCLIHPSVMMRMRALETAGGYSTEYAAAEDYELFFRLLGHASAAALPEALTTAVTSRAGISATRRRAQLRSKLRVQWRYFDPARPQSYLGVTLTLLLFIVPSPLLGFLKRVAGVTRY